MDQVLMNGVRLTDDGFELHQPKGFSEFVEEMAVLDFLSRGIPKSWSRPLEVLTPEKRGWAVIFHEDEEADTREALYHLLECRRTQFGDSYRELIFKTGDSKESFCARYGFPTLEYCPRNLPFYLLIVGSPEHISFEFQRTLAVHHGVGRLSFRNAQGYKNYALNLANHEEALGNEAKSFAVFAPENGDRLSSKSRQCFAGPVLESVSSLFARVTAHLGKEATCSELQKLLSGSSRPDLLLTVSHGVEPQRNIEALQGSLLCADWQEGDLVNLGAVFSDQSLPPNCDLRGMISVLFACFSLGTPVWDSRPMPFANPLSMHSRPFVSRLAEEMLGREKGGLAVLGHIDRAWPQSFCEGDQIQIAHFSGFLRALLGGVPIGSALNFLRMRTCELGTLFLTELIRPDGKVDKKFLTKVWMAFQDAFNYSLLGDPAIRLRRGQVFP